MPVDYYGQFNPDLGDLLGLQAKAAKANASTDPAAAPTAAPLFPNAPDMTGAPNATIDWESAKAAGDKLGVDLGLGARPPAEPSRPAAPVAAGSSPEFVARSAAEQNAALASVQEQQAPKAPSFATGLPMQAVAGVKQGLAGVEQAQASQAMANNAAVQANIDAAQQELDATKKINEIERQKIQAQAQGEAERARVMQEHQAKIDAGMKEHYDNVTNLKDQVAKAKIDPKRLFNDMGAWSKIGLAISIAMSEVGRAIAGQGGPNPVMGMIYKAIDDDVAQQANAQAGLKEQLGEAKAEVPEALQRFANEGNQLQAGVLARTQAAIKALDAQIPDTKDMQATAAYNRMRGELLQRAGELEAKMAADRMDSIKQAADTQLAAGSQLLREREATANAAEKGQPKAKSIAADTVAAIAALNEIDKASSESNAQWLAKVPLVGDFLGELTSKVGLTDYVGQDELEALRNAAKPAVAAALGFPSRMTPEREKQLNEMIPIKVGMSRKQIISGLKDVLKRNLEIQQSGGVGYREPEDLSQYEEP